MKRGKKGVVVNVRLTKTQKMLFKRRCRKEGLNTSEVIRGLINKAMNMDNGELKNWLNVKT